MFKIRLIKISYLISFLFMLVLILTGCSHQKSSGSVADSPKVRVVTSTNVYGEVAKKVAGKYGQVRSLINSPSVDPHDFEPTIKDAKMLSRANVILENGLGYDAWMNKLLEASGNQKATKISVGETLLGKKDGDNEHVWYDSKTMPAVANRLVSVYSQIDPEHANEYRQNAQNYLKAETSVNNLIEQLKNNKGTKTAVDVSEPVIDYQLQELGYAVHNKAFAKAIEDGSDPTPEQVKAIQRDIAQHRIAFFVENTQSRNQLVTSLVKLAHQHDIPVVKVTESLPRGQTYRQWMLDQLMQIKKAQEARISQH